MCIRDTGLRALLMKNVCVQLYNYILHAAPSPCQCSGYHRDGISVNHLLPALSDCFVSAQLATVSSLLAPTHSPAVRRRWEDSRAAGASACRRWPRSDRIDRAVEESIRGLPEPPEAAYCVLLNLIPLYWRTN